MTMKSVLAAVSISVGCLASIGAQADEPVLDQNWSPKDLALWQNTSQGSRLVPLSWLMALEVAGQPERFLSDKNITTYGYTPHLLPFNGEVYRLPRGFVIDQGDDRTLTFSRLRWYTDQRDQEPWVGLNCAACHTANITHGDNTWVIQGGPTNADFQAFLDAFRAALYATADNEETFDRFARKVLKDGYTPANRLQLHTALNSLAQFLKTGASLNATNLEYGPGRVDAVGHILNRVAQLNGAMAQTPNPSDAPVSYPFLWNTPQHDVVQWNGVAPNKRLGKNGLDIGALARNASEVVGVFGDVAMQQGPLLKGFISSVRVKNLDQLERTLQKLKPPKWPEKLGAIDRSKASLGAELFKQKCVSCHLPLARDNLTAPITAQMIAIAAEESPSTIASDPWMACNAVQFTSAPGNLLGEHLNAKKGHIDHSSPLVTQLGVAAREILLNQKSEIIDLALRGAFHVEPLVQLQASKDKQLSMVETLLPADKAYRLDQCYTLAKMTTVEDGKTVQKYPLAYKARPLTGIWATAPYLHNGSVPTLYDLLLPAEQRPSRFKTGSTRFDPQKVGFIDAFGPGSPFTYDTSLPGNFNVGHDYGASSFSDDERYALVEYMKTL
ncbi:di-heme-cytochrome C peroxidase [Pseudomonas sp. NPDC087612]|uniref:di-heme-cytochrome C peroxidase n=1 Tax=Pseudomonas sp. NPDC087612 TaxID=3364441 RepID=UPI00382A5E95